jgi:hypothetical protein
MAISQSLYADYFINIKPLATSNTVPIISGQVNFERNKNQTILITVNYVTYELFKGNLGLDESVKPNVWKLHMSSPLYPGIYDVEANVVDVTNDIVVASDNAVGELTILSPTPAQIQQQNVTIPQKVAIVTGLLNAVATLPGSGGNSGVGGNPSVHPATDDDGTTGLAGRADKERDEDPRVKDKDKRQQPNIIPAPPKSHPFGVVGAGGGGFGALGGLISGALGGALGGIAGAAAAALGVPTSLSSLADKAMGGSVLPSMGDIMGKVGEAAGKQAEAGSFDFTASLPEAVKSKIIPEPVPRPRTVDAGTTTNNNVA